MGLGPPCCDKCQVVAILNNDTKEWKCFVCDNTTLTNLWRYDQKQQDHNFNTDFYWMIVDTKNEIAREEGNSNQQQE